MGVQWKAAGVIRRHPSQACLWHSGLYYQENTLPVEQDILPLSLIHLKPIAHHKVAERGLIRPKHFITLTVQGRDAMEQAGRNREGSCFFQGRV